MIADTIEIVAVEVNRAIGAIPSALLTLVDGDMPESAWPAADSDSFVPGAKIAISAGYATGLECIFEGIVVRLSATISETNESRLLVYCQDEAVRMTLGRKSANFIDHSDADILSTLIGAYGLAADVTATQPVHSAIVQYDCSDWDFLMMRAEANGLMVIADAGKVSATPPDLSGPPVLGVTWGEDLSEFRAEMDARGQLPSASATSWDPGHQAIVQADASGRNLNFQGNLSQADLAEALGVEALALRSAAMLDAETLRSWADAQQVRSGLARIQGHMSFVGSAAVALGSLIEVKGVSQRFSGDAFVAGFTHSIADGNWQTRVEFGLSARAHADKFSVASPGAAGLLAPAQGFQLGTVLKVDQDPAGEFRIQVDIPVLQAGSGGVWARLVQTYASRNSGTFYVPEIGDEVLIGYINDDPSSPIIMGSLYSSSRAPPYTPAADNAIKAIVTRKARIEIDDRAGTVTIKTSSNNAVILSDRDKSISLADEHGNAIKLDADGIALDSCKDIRLSAKGRVTAEATDTIGLSAGTTMAASGLDVTISAQSALTCKGGASTEVSALGQTVVRGAMVMIN